MSKENHENIQSILNRLKTAVNSQAEIVNQLSLTLRKQLSLILAPYNEIANNPDLDLSVPMRKMLENSRRQAENLNKILNIAQELFKRKSSGLLTAAPMDIISIINRAIRLLSNQISEKGIQVKIKHNEPELELYLDKEKILTGLITIVDHALRLIDKGGSLELKIYRSQGSREDGKSFVNIDVSGYHNQSLAQFKADFEKSRSYFEYSGELLADSLAISQFILESHGGEIFIVDDPENDKIFRLTLPEGMAHLLPGEIHSQEAPTAEPAESEHFYKYGTNSPIPDFKPDDRKSTVLIVDDEIEMRVLLKAILQEDYNILEAKNGLEAFDLVLKFMPDLVISDIMMPEMDGFSFVKMIKKDLKITDIPVIFVTAVSADADRIKGLETRADAYITKPFNSKELKVIAKNLIEKHHRITLRYASNLELQNPEQVHLKGQDKRLLERVREHVIANLSNPDYSPDDISKAVFISRRQLERKLKQLTSLTPNKYILEIRLLTAKELLKNKATWTVSEASAAVGFNNQAYFSRLFSKKFGVSPGKLIKQAKQD